MHVNTERLCLCDYLFPQHSGSKFPCKCLLMSVVMWRTTEMRAGCGNERGPLSQYFRCHINLYSDFEAV